MNHKWVGSLRFGWAYGFAHNYCFVFLLLREFNFNVFQTYIVGHVHIERKIIRKPWSRNGRTLPVASFESKKLSDLQIYMLLQS